MSLFFFCKTLDQGSGFASRAGITNFGQGSGSLCRRDHRFLVVFLGRATCHILDTCTWFAAIVWSGMIATGIARATPKWPFSASPDA